MAHFLPRWSIVKGASTGTKIWSFSTGVTVLSAPAVFNDMLCWGVGGDSNCVAGRALYAFGLPI